MHSQHATQDTVLTAGFQLMAVIYGCSPSDESRTAKCPNKMRYTAYSKMACKLLVKP